MATISSAFYRDGNRVPITNQGLITKRTITFAGGTTGAWGDDGGALDGAAILCTEWNKHYPNSQNS